MNNRYGRFEHAILATDMVVFTVRDEKLQVLLIKTNKPEFKGKWALPGGLVQAEADLLESAQTHLKNKTGVTGIYLEQLQTFGKPDRDPFGRVVSVAYIALVPSNKHDLVTTSEYDDIAWVPIHEVESLAYDHNDILNTAFSRLKAKLEYTNIVSALLPKDFTLSDLQEMYEVILQKEFDKRNFRKKILSIGTIEETGEMTSGEAYRPAKLYRFKTTKLQDVEML